MAPWNRSTVAGRLHAARSGGTVSVVAGLASAMALAGAAVYTVEGTTCGDGGQYVRHADGIELVDSCVDGAELPEVRTPHTGASGRDGAFAEHSNYRP